MPRPPDIDDFAKVNFIVNYLLMGCSPPFFLFCEFAREPTEELALLFMLPDFTDIGQAIFDPKKGRRRKPARHGRKKPRRRGFPDPSDLIGQRARGVLNPGNALNFGPVNKAFRIWNAYEGIAIAAAVLDGVTSIGYEGLLGVLTIDPTHCREFARLVARDDSVWLTGGAAPPVIPVDIDHVEVSVGFIYAQSGCRLDASDYHVNYRQVVHNGDPTESIEVSIALGVPGQGARWQSTVRTLGPGETVVMNIDGAFAAGELCEWGCGQHLGFPVFLSREVVAFGKSDIPWPW